ncbi:MAG: hypothetical protein ACOCWY_02720, partial [Thermodesulfobacteriota bacterium]
MKHILHLAGEQSLPVYMGIMQYQCPHHVIAVTDSTRDVGAIVQAVAQDANRTIDLLTVDPYNLPGTVQQLNMVADQYPHDDWAFNLTGGTKPMFAAAYQVAQRRQIPTFYIETMKQTIDWLDESGQRDALQPTVHAVDTFVRLAGYATLLPPEGTISPLDHPH